MAEISRPELCIVGAGALGIALAQHARALGAQVTLVDRGSEPADGPQRALHMAALMASAATAASMRNADALGIAGVAPKISMKAVQERALQVVSEGAKLDSHTRLTALGIEVLVGQARFVDANMLAVGDTQLRPQAIVLAVGADAVIPDIPGLEEAGYFTPDTLLENTRKLTHLLVIGADPEGLALAQAWARLGSEVTLVPQGLALAGFDIESASILMQQLAEDGVRVVDGGSVEAIQPRSQGIGVSVSGPQGDVETLDVSHIVICAGGSVRLDDLGLEAARLRWVRGKAGQLAIGPLGQTSNRRVRAVGAAAGLDQWQHALSHGRAVIEALILGVPRHRPVHQPQLIQTEPGLAQLGRWPAEGKTLAPGHQIVRAGLGENDKARALGQQRGLVKILVNPKGRIVAASVVCPAAGELAGVLALAMDRDVPVSALADISLPHPSLLQLLAAMGGNQNAVPTVSSWTRRLGAMRRRLRF